MGNKPIQSDATTRCRRFEIPPTEFVGGKLPDELWLRIFRLLGLQQLLDIQRCCKRFSEIARDNSIWSPICRKWIVDRQHALRLARRRRMASILSEIESTGQTEKMKERTPWWGEYAPEEEEEEALQGLGEKPLWKEAFAAWKIARDHTMLRRCERCAEYFYEKDNRYNSCTYHPGTIVTYPGQYRRDTNYTCCGLKGPGCKKNRHKKTPTDLQEFQVD